MVDEVFSGELRSTIVCCTCGSVSCAHEPFLDLSLPVPRRGRLPTAAEADADDANTAEGGDAAADGVASGDGDSAHGGAPIGLTEAVLAKLPAELTAAQPSLQLRSCLAAFCAPETLRGENAYDCDVCAKAVAAEAATKADAQADASGAPPAKPKQPGVKWLQVRRLPKVVTLHLKRFRTSGQHVHKLDEHVPFPLVLDFSPFACAPGEPVKHFSNLADGFSQPEAQLKLYAVVEHQVRSQIALDCT